MDDANTRQPSQDYSLPQLPHDYPRIHVHEIGSGVGAQEYSKYQFITAHGNAYPLLEQIQQNHSPDTMMLRHISGRAYQQYAYGYCVISGGLAFESTTASSQGGPSAAGCGMYAGHFLYRAGTRLRQSIGAGDTTLQVESASRIDSGQYVVIYNSPAGTFNNAEHARVTSVNRSNNTIQVQRGYKSASSNHASGSIVAQHILGQGPDARLWAFNLSTQSPRDGSGRTFGQFYADWLGQNLLKHGKGTRTSAKVAGLLFDADFYSEFGQKQVDYNNDLVVDEGMGPDSTNWLGKGLDEFYQRVTQRLPGYYVLVGVHNARGYDSAHGTQMENWLDYGNGDYTPNPRYSKLGWLVTAYLYNMGERANGPPLTMNLTKTPTNVYSGHTGWVESNTPFRLALTMSLMDDGYFGTHAELDPDAWWDEFAVDVRAGSPTFGNAIAKTSVSQIHEHRGWMGQPLGKFQRIYSDANFATTRSLIGNGSFDSNLTGWSSTGVYIRRVTSGTRDGAGAMHVASPGTFTSNPFGVTVDSSRASITANASYTLVFSARASEARDIRVSLGNDTYPVPVGPQWRRYVVTMNPTANATAPVRFALGGENTEVWFDSVYLFPGDANVFRRDFENGIALANATDSWQTISVGDGFRRINGTQDRSVNNGNAVTSVTLAPFDGILLVRNVAQSGPAPAPAPSGDTAAIGDRVWRDDDGDGIQDSGEPGWSGVTVRLRQCNGPVLATLATDADGRYSFEALAAGSNLQIEFVKPSSASFSAPYRANWSIDSDADTASGLTQCVTMTSNTQRREGVDAGLVPTGPAQGGSSIGDFVWNDSNGNGFQDSWEPGVGNVQVQLRTCNDQWLANQTTAADGSYSFDGLVAGSYRVQFIAPSGTVFTVATVGNDWSIDSDADRDGRTPCRTISDNDVRRAVDAGLRY